MLKTSIIAPESGKRSTVSDARALLVEKRPVPPFGQNLDAIILNGFMTDENGSENMVGVFTPAAPGIFSVRARENADIYIGGISILITGTDMAPGDFGAGAPLIDPCIFTYQTETSRVVLADDITSNFDLMRLSGEFNPSTGDLASAVKISSPAMGGATDDAYVPFIDFMKVYGFEYGVKIAADSEQRFDFVIQDDTTGADVFNMRVFGFARARDTDRP